jgi:N-glycosylase/DNA lyase
VLDADAGGKEWLLALRDRPFAETIEVLTQFSGVGPKVAACVALFSCDKHCSIPVDTHVWRLACQRYMPAMRGKTLTPKLHPLVMEVRMLAAPSVA